MPMRILRAAQGGGKVDLVGYHGAMMGGQSKWQIGGSASQQAHVWQVAFPGAHRVVEQLKSGVHWVWLPGAGGWGVLQNCAPGTFQDHRPGEMPGGGRSSWMQCCCTL